MKAYVFNFARVLTKTKIYRLATRHMATDRTRYLDVRSPAEVE